MKPCYVFICCFFTVIITTGLILTGYCLGRAAIPQRISVMADMNFAGKTNLPPLKDVY